MTEFKNLTVERAGNTIFIALPEGAGEVIPGGCECPYCKAHPEKTPRWDTLAVEANPTRKFARETCGRVHYPELER